MQNANDAASDEPNVAAYDIAYGAVDQALGNADVQRGRDAIQGALDAVVQWSGLTHAEVAGLLG
jgi:hypothetical protein